MFEWNKAGRPRTKEKPEWLEQDWTAEEKSILVATERASIPMLAIAVVKQWIRDGRPKSDYDGIKPWLSVISDSITAKNKQLDLTSIGGMND